MGVRHWTMKTIAAKSVKAEFEIKCLDDCSEAYAGSAGLFLLASAALKSTGAVTCDAARKDAVHAKRSEFRVTDVRVVN